MKHSIEESTRFQWSFYSTEPQTSVVPRLRDGEIGSRRKFVHSKGTVALLCDSQGNPAPSAR
jgi:hypothetical protein